MCGAKQQLVVPEGPLAAQQDGHGRGTCRRRRTAFRRRRGCLWATATGRGTGKSHAKLTLKESKELLPL